MRRNLRVMYAISFFQGMVFYASVSTLYRQAAGVSVFQMTVIESISWFLSFALELPWGILADRIGYRRVMILCNGLYFVSKVVFWRANGFLDFLVERILLAVVTSGLSGVDSSIIYMSAGPDGSQRAFGLAGAFGTAGVLISVGIYALFLGDDYRAAAFLTVISYFIAAALTFGLKEVRTSDRAKRTSLRRSLAILRDIFKNRPLIRLVVAFSLLGEACRMVTVVLNQLQYTRAGMSAGLISAMYMLMTLTDFTSVLSAPLTKRLGQRNSGVVLFGLCAASCVILALTRDALLSALGVLMISVCAAILSPLDAKLENDAVTAADRATALSMAALIGDVLSASLELAFGWLADLDLSAALIFGGATTVLGAAFFVKSQSAPKAKTVS